MNEGLSTAKAIRWVARAAVIVVFIFVCLFNMFYTLDVEHAAVVTTFGDPQAILDTGLHVKVPFIQKVSKVDTTVQGMAIGWDFDTNASIDSDSTMISSDFNFINVDFYVEWQVSDPIRFLYASNSPYNVLKSEALNSIRTVVASYPVDAVLTTGKSEIQSNIKSMLIDKMETLDIGITVRNVTMQDSEPPNSEVKTAFSSVEDARQGRDTAINNANKYRNEQLPIANAEVDKILQEAEAAKAQRIAEAQGQVARFNAMYDEYIKFPEVTRERMFYEYMEDILPNLKVIINGGEGEVQSFLPLESFMSINGGGSSVPAINVE